MGTGFLIAIIVGFATQLSQPVPAPDDRWPVSLEITMGYGVGGSSGEYRRSGGGPAVDVLVAARLRSTLRGAWVGAVSLAAQPILVSSDDRCIPASDGGCVPDFPGLPVVSLLGGWETAGGAQRVMVGPGLTTEVDWRKSKLVWVLRVDGALPMTGRISMVGSIRGTLVPSFQGASFRQGSLMAGLRIR